MTGVVSLARRQRHDVAAARYEPRGLRRAARRGVGGPSRSRHADSAGRRVRARGVGRGVWPEERRRGVVPRRIIGSCRECLRAGCRLQLLQHAHRARRRDARRSRRAERTAGRCRCWRSAPAPAGRPQQSWRAWPR